MKDIDFDELDRAVNSLMNDKETANTPAVNTEEKAFVLQETMTDDKHAPELPVSLTPEAEPTTSSAEVSTSSQTQKPQAPSTSTPKVAPRKSGRYMDMISGARKPSTPTLRSHGANTLSAPTSSPIAETATPTDAVVDAGTAFPTDNATPPASETPGVSASGAVDVVEPTTPDTAQLDDTMQAQLEAALMSDETHHADTATEAQSTDTVVDVPDRAQPTGESPIVPKVSPTEAPQEQATPTPQSGASSPFLSDAKVEKRPLGGASSIENSELATTAGALEAAPADEEPTQSAEDESAQTQPAPTPPEFHEDLLAVEADAQPPQADNEPVKASPPEITTSPVQAGNPSIHQQYKEKESTGDQSHTPIYDSNVQPLTHPAKKKSGWGVIVLILLVVLVCVGGVIALYVSGIL